MPNVLTGDFEAVLQVSGATVNRLLASMHQNSFANTALPSFPHSLWMRIGDDHAIDGVRGTVEAQVSVPRVDLIQGATDRFELELGLRVRCKPDPGTIPLPQFINGNMRAQYTIEDIDPHCLGWATRASDYLWVRVVKDSVEFDGTWEDDRGVFEILRSAAELDAATQAMHASITRQIAELCATRFEATPHKVSKRFRRGAMRSLSAGPAASAVAIAVGLSAEPAGQIASITTQFLGDADFGIAVSREYIEAMAQPLLDGVVGLQRDFHVSVDLGAGGGAEIDYSARVDTASLGWSSVGSVGVIKLTLTGQGWCPRLYLSGVANVIPANAADLRTTFTAEQSLLVGFDPGSERLTVTAPEFWSPAVAVGTVTSWGGLVSGYVKDGLSNALKARVPGAIVQVQPQLDTLTSDARKAELINQLRTLDDRADAHFDRAVFSADGIVVGGTIPLTARHPPMAGFDKTPEGDGYSALQSWFPGGRIDEIDWAWSWVGQQGNAGTASYQSRFLLTRPPGQGGRFEQAIGASEPLPGLDGGGTICVTIKGVQVDAATGRLVPAQSTRRCVGYRLSTTVSVGGGRLLLSDTPELSHRVPFPQLALLDAGTTRGPSAANTLLLYLGGRWNPEVTESLRRGLEATVRHDAGLLVLILVREGQLAQADRGLTAEVHALTAPLGVATVVSEDVHGGWSAAFALPAGTAEPAWRLISPGGGVTWMHDGVLSGEMLAAALDEGLFPSPRPTPVPMGLGVDIGDQVSGNALDLGAFRTPESHCPRIGVDRVGLAGSLVSFVQLASDASIAQLRTLAVRHEQRDEHGPLVLAVADGASAREVEHARHELGLDFAVLPDESGAIADGLGVWIWPTTLRLDRSGTVSGIEFGSADRAPVGSG